MKKFPSIITVLIWKTTFEGYGSSWEIFYCCHVKSITCLFMQEFSRFRSISASL